jgi:hypothetical protein
MRSMGWIELHVTINGTDTNPWHRFGLRRNPFPQTGKAEYAAGERKLASLDAAPVRTADDIRERLAGFDQEFAGGVIQRWQPGHRVRFKIVFPGPEQHGRTFRGTVRRRRRGGRRRAAGGWPAAGWEPVTGPLTEVRTREHGTNPLPDPGWLPGHRHAGRPGPRDLPLRGAGHMSGLTVAVAAGRRQYQTRTTGEGTCTGSPSTTIPGRSGTTPASRTEARAAGGRRPSRRWSRPGSGWRVPTANRGTSAGTAGTGRPSWPWPSS